MTKAEKAIKEAAKRCKPCPFCGESLIVKQEPEGDFYLGHNKADVSDARPCDRLCIIHYTALYTPEAVTFWNERKDNGISQQGTTKAPSS